DCRCTFRLWAVLFAASVATLLRRDPARVMGLSAKADDRPRPPGQTCVDSFALWPSLAPSYDLMIVICGGGHGSVLVFSQDKLEKVTKDRDVPRHADPQGKPRK